MALFNKLFHPRRSAAKDSARHHICEDNIVPFTFDRTQVRVLLFRECERRGRKLLYDSSDNKFEPCRDGDKKNNKDVQSKERSCSDDVQSLDNVQCKLTNSDAPLLGEMIFGAVAMNYKGMSLKIHVLKSPQRLMCTKVYCNSVRICPPNETFTSSHSSMSTHSERDLYSSNKLSPWPSFGSNSQIPASYLTKDDHLTVNCLISKTDSGFSSQPSSHSSIGCHSGSYELWSKSEESFPSDLLLFGSSLGDSNWSNSSSIHWQFTHTSTFDNQSSLLNIPPRRKESEVSRSSIASSTSDSMDNSGRSTQSRRIKVGIAIIITLTEKSASKMLSFLMDHAFLMEGALARLKCAVHQALCKPPLFLSTMAVASREAAQWFVDLLTCPRIGFPMWPTLSSSNKSFMKGGVADIFMNDFCSLLCTMDTKDTYFFMSTLLTNILTFHLGWVNSVSPYKKDLDSVNNTCAPSNPLLAQLGELYGVIGIPSRASRTIVYGKQNTLLVQKILTVLTYFIRCMAVKRYEFECPSVLWENVDNLINCHQTENVSHNSMNSFDDKVQVKNYDDIEMRTFSSNQYKCKDDTLTFNEESTITDLNTSLLTENGDHLKYSSQSLSNEYKDNLFLCTDSGVNTVIDLKSVNQCSNEIKKITKTVSGFKNGVVNGVPSEMKKLCRAPTSGLLSNLISDNRESIQSVKNISEPFIETGLRYANESSTDVQNNVANSKSDKNNVVFILGEDEELIGLRNSNSDLKSVPDNVCEPKQSDVSKETSPSPEIIHALSHDSWDTEHQNNCCARTPQCQHSSFKKHSGVKFDFEKYPQIVTNYMKSKNLELLDRHVIGKPGNLKFVDCEGLEAGGSIFDLPKDCDTCQNCSFTGQGLQTPSNASELEYTSDIPNREFQYAKECVVNTSEPKVEEPKVFVKKKLVNTLVVNEPSSSGDQIVTSTENLSCDSTAVHQEERTTIELPLNGVSVLKEDSEKSGLGYCNSLLGSVSDHYISDLVLQGGVGGTRSDWEKLLCRDLKLHPGTTCLLADVDDWSVRVFGSSGGGVGDMSTLVASMLDCIPQMCHAKVPSLQCLAFIESKLREMCVRSKGLAQLLIDKDFCDMEYLTKTLNLEPNDVPLLLAIASTHTPQATLKYGVSYR